VRALALIFAIYFSVFTLSELAGSSWIWWLLALPLIGGLQNHLFLLHHEGAHGLLHPRRAVNDFLTNFFCGYPIFESLSAYRRFHFAHHRHVCDEKRDPEIPFYREQGYHYRPLGGLQKLKLALLDLSGYHWLQFFVSFLVYSSRGEGMRGKGREKAGPLIAFGITVAFLLAAGGGPALFWFWFVPQVTVAFYFMKLRGYYEHGARRGEMESFTGNRPVPVWQKFFVFPLRSNLHAAHHRNPSREWFRLGAN
jgi:fatty acid desaturase